MRRRWSGIALALVLLGCGSEQSKMERGVVVDQEEAVPATNQEMDETAKKRRKQETSEEERASQRDFDEAEQESGQ